MRCYVMWSIPVLISAASYAKGDSIPSYVWGAIFGDVDDGGASGSQFGAGVGPCFEDGCGFHMSVYQEFTVTSTVSRT